MECEYHDICKRDSTEGNRCILHQERRTKDSDQFASALDEHLRVGRTDFRHMYFPNEGYSFPDELEGATIDFRQAVFHGPVEFGSHIRGNIDFTDAQFDREANFEATSFHDAATFENIHFKSVAIFRDAFFSGPTVFRGQMGKTDFAQISTQDTLRIGAAFTGKVNLKGAQFHQDLFLHNSVFHNTVNCDKVKCGGTFNASEVRCKENARFADARFLGKAIFEGATFAGSVSFALTEFNEKPNFSKTTFEGNADFGDCRFESGAAFGLSSFQKNLSFGHVRSNDTISFFRADFRGKTDFGLSFLSEYLYDCEKVTFAQATFHNDVHFRGQHQKTPIFEDCLVVFSRINLEPRARIHFRHADLSQAAFLGSPIGRIEFTGVQWCQKVAKDEWFPRVGLFDEVKSQEESGDRFGPPWSAIEGLYRQLKRSYQERGDYSRAGDFHIGEKEMRRKNPSTRSGMKALLWAYRAVSKYGERALPAVGCLAVLILLCAIGYVVLGVSSPYGDYALEGSSLSHWGESLVISAKASLLFGVSPSFSHLGAEIIRLLQAVVSPPLLALLALALRQQVKR